MLKHSFLNISGRVGAIVLALLVMTPASSVAEEACHGPEIAALDVTAQNAFDQFVQDMVLADVLGGVTGKKSYILSKATTQRENGAPSNQSLFEFQSSTDNKVDKKVIPDSLKAMNRALEGDITKYQAEPFYSKALFCAMDQVASYPDTNYTRSLDNYRRDLAKKINTAQIGHFIMTVEKCSAKERVGTGNRFAEPEAWEGSRFLIIETAIKNVDTEGRLPFEGSAIIKSEGNEYKFDTMEHISLKGYGIYLRSLNPLVTMRTKIVFRIPDELAGEVYWKPGRNEESQELWCMLLPKSGA